MRPWARSIKSKVLKKEMPPWGVGQSTLKFSNDRQMSEKEIFTLVSWVDAGAPKGNDADLPPPPEYPGGWKFNREPDVVLKMPVEFKIEPRSEYPMLDFYVPIPWTDGMKLIQMSEARPSNKAVVHHITVSLVTFPPGTEVIDGQPFTTDAAGNSVPLDRRTARITEQKLPAELQIPREPGEKPDRLSSVGGFTTLLAYVAGRGFDDHPDGVGTPALPGQYINFNMHYTPTGRPEVDRSEVGLWFAKEPLKKFHFRTPINERQHVNGKLVRGAIPDAADVEAGRVSQGATAATISSFSGLPPIPPYMADFTVTSELAITQDITINGFYPHMHVRGKVGGVQGGLSGWPRAVAVRGAAVSLRLAGALRARLAVEDPEGELAEVSRRVRQLGGQPAQSQSRQGSVLVRAELGRDEPRLDRIHARQAAVETLGA